MKKRILQMCICLIITCISGFISAQSVTIKGTVLSEEDDMPQIGASIMIKGTTRGTVTDLDGHFTLDASIHETLQVFYTGFATKEVTVTGPGPYTIYLSQNEQLLQDVVIVGYKREIKENVSTSISSIKAENISKLPVIGLDQAMQGQAPGVQVTQTTGAPGDDIAVRIRGAGTLGNNNPLYIVDGVPTTGNINMFSITDIESIEILKDGAAASIYGSRAANGVVLITTKKGKSGEPTFSFDTYVGIQQANRLPKLLNSREYLMIRNEAISNSNELREPSRQIPTYDLAILDTLPDIDWLDLVFNPAPMQRHSLSASGGGDNGNFYIQGEYFNQEGVFKKQGFDKYNLRFNGQLGKKRLSIGNNISLSYTKRNVIGSSGDGAGPGNELSGIRYALIAAPVFSPYYADGSYIPTSAFLSDPNLYGDGNANPLAFIDATDWTIQRYRLFGNLFAEYKFLDNLIFRTNVGTDFLFQDETVFKQRLSAAIYDPTSLSRGNVADRTLIWNNTLDYNVYLDNANRHHQVNVLIGMEAISNRVDYLGASARNFFRFDPNFRYIDNSLTEEIGDIDASGLATEWGLFSLFGQAGYNYRNRYIINASVRRDGSSRFGKKNRYGTFPAASVAWNISNEPFFNLPVVSHLKVRASWGQLGNQEIGIYPFSSLVSTGNNVYVFGGQIATGTQLQESGNENIRWETTTQTDFGLELNLWEDKLSLQADYYNKLTEDVLVRVPLPQSAGDFAPPYVNAGTVRNRGFEFGLTYRNKMGQLGYSISANIATVHNEVVSLAGTEPLLGGFGLSDGPITRTEPGYAMGSFYLYQMEGIFQSQEEIDAAPFQSNDTRPGDIRFADLNGDNIIDSKDRAHLGNPFPDFTYGANLQLSYKGFDLTMLLQGVQGNDVYFLYGNFAYETQLRGFNSYADILDRWTPTNTETDIPRVSVDDRNRNRRISTRFLEDGSYMRIKNLTLGYDLTNIVKIKGISSWRLYVSAQNLLTVTNYSGLDPEIQANTNDTRGYNVSSDLAVGIDWGTVPAPRVFLFGMNLNF